MRFWRWSVLLIACIIVIPPTVGGAAAVPDTPFYQDVHVGYPLVTTAENDVRALALDADGRVWAATADGVRYLADGQWKAPAGGAGMGLTYALYRDLDGTLWAGAWNGIFRVTTQTVTPGGITGSAVGAIGGLRAGSSSETIVAAGPGGIWRLKNGEWARVRGRWQTAIRAVQPAPDGSLWIGTASGLYRKDLGTDAPTRRYGKPDLLLSSDISSLAVLPDGRLCIGSSGGVDFYKGIQRVSSLTARDGMPNHHVRGFAWDRDGRLWIATELGVARLDGKTWNLRHSRRWLQSDDVRAVLVGPDGTAWVATASGVDAIRRQKMTLAEKADYFLKLVRARHIRPPGLVGPAVLATPGDVSRSFIEDDDNDGEHTGMYCGLESMRYAVTHAPDARANAKAAFHALMVLQQATGTRHFIARSVLPAGTAARHEVDRTFTPQEIAETARTDPREKIIERRWVPSPDGKWLWKRDASSDEIVGHMFGYCTYYDLAADEDEKKLVADQVDRIVGGIVDHGYTLQDIDGKATRWGHWGPQDLNDDPNWNEERPGNSVEIISHLGVAYHLTGNHRFADAARTLIGKYGYDRNLLDTNFDTPSERTHIEDELLSLTYPNLLSHPVLQSVEPTGKASMVHWHRSNERDGIPFYDFVYNRFSGQQVPLDRAVEALRDWPLDMIEWTVDNSRRDDIEYDRTPGLENGMLTRLLPRSEMGLCTWDQEPYKVSIGNGGQREEKGIDWLLAYWMGRYYGLLAAP